MKFDIFDPFGIKAKRLALKRLEDERQQAIEKARLKSDQEREYRRQRAAMEYDEMMARRRRETIDEVPHIAYLYAAMDNGRETATKIEGHGGMFGGAGASSSWDDSSSKSSNHSSSSYDNSSSYSSCDSSSSSSCGSD